MALKGAPAVTIVANDVGPVGGMETQLSQLISGLLERGIEVTVVSWTCDLSSHPKLRWIRVPGPSRPFALAYPLFVLLSSLIVRLRARGVVHSTGALVLGRVGVCTVHYCHSAATDHGSFSRASRPNAAYRFNGWVGTVLSRIGERWCYRRGRTGRLIAVSGGLAEDLRRRFPAVSDRIEVIPNGVDTKRFHPPEASRNEGVERPLRAIFVGSEWERKGLAEAIEAVRQGDDDVSLTVVGGGDTPTYEALADRLGVGNRVRFVGKSAEVADWYRWADVFVLPTSYEAAPLSCYEAAASGLPLLVTKVSGVSDFLRDGINGWFVKKDPVDIGKRLSELSKRPEQRVRMGRVARQDSSGCSWASVVDRYIELYAELGW